MDHLDENWKSDAWDDEARNDEARRNRLSLLFLLAGPGKGTGSATFGDPARNALAFSRTISQALKTAYGEGPASGAFHAGGLNGAIQ